jgi:hypothetical protein
VEPSQRRRHVLNELCEALIARYTFAGGREYIEDAVSSGEDALSMSVRDHAACPMTLTTLGNALRVRAEVLGRDEDREVAERRCEEALSLCDIGHPLRPKASRHLAICLIRRCERTGVSSCLDDAINLLRDALNALRDEHEEERFRCLSVLAAFLMQRNELLHDPKDLQEALNLHRMVVASCSDTHSQRQLSLNRLTQGLLNNYQQSGALQDLEEALATGRRAITAGVPGGVSQTRAHSLALVASILCRRFDVRSVLDSDLDELVKLRQESLTMCPPGHFLHWLQLDGLATAFGTRFLWNGNLNDLEESVRLRREAAVAVPDGDPRRNMAVSNLAEDLTLRYRELGNIDDLEEGLRLFQAEFKMRPQRRSDHNPQSMFMISALCLRFEALPNAEDINRAISLSQELIESYPPGHHARPRAIQRLANALILRGCHYGGLEDIDWAIGLLRTNLEPDYWASTSGTEHLLALSTSYLARFRRTRDTTNALAAEELLRNLVDQVPRGRRDRFQCLLQAAELYLEPGTTFQHIETAVAYLKDGVTDNHRDIRSRLEGAVRLLQATETHLSEDTSGVAKQIRIQMLGIYSVVVGLLPRLAFFGLDLSSRLESLSIGQSVAAIGASHALQIARPEMALEILEQGRATFWTHTLHLRSQFDMVPEEHRVQLLSLAQQLERTNDISDASSNKHLIEQAIARRRQQTERFNLLVEEVRSLPNLTRFMLPDEYSTLSQVANKAPVVVLVSSRLACHAVVMRSASNTPINVPLPLLDDAWLVASGGKWRSAMVDARSAMRDRLMVKTAKTAKPKAHSAPTVVDDILEGLWSKLVLPILRALDIQVNGNNMYRIARSPTYS